MFERLLLPLDGSQLAESAVPLATEIAHKFDSEVLILHVEQEAASAEPTKIGQLTGHYLDSIQTTLSRANVRSRTKITQGEAAQEIVKVASNEGASLIVMSTHGSTGRRTIEPGSVATEVLARSHVPVCFVKPSEYRST